MRYAIKTGYSGRTRSSDENQLELFLLPDPRSVEKNIKRLEIEILLAMRTRDFGLAADLAQQQKSLIQNQIDSPR